MKFDIEMMRTAATTTVTGKTTLICNIFTNERKKRIVS
jgi:hypothetical protein